MKNLGFLIFVCQNFLAFTNCEERAFYDKAGLEINNKDKNKAKGVLEKLYKDSNEKVLALRVMHPNNHLPTVSLIFFLILKNSRTT